MKIQALICCQSCKLQKTVRLTSKKYQARDESITTSVSASEEQANHVQSSVALLVCEYPGDDDARKENPDEEETERRLAVIVLYQP